MSEPDDGPQFSHFGIFVTDLETVAAFYRSTLDFIETDRGTLGERQIIFLSRDPREHHQLAFVSGRGETPREEVVNQISFRLPTLGALKRYVARAMANGASDLRAICHGNAWAAYFRDPEGNRIELFVDSPWYVAQPCREPLDLQQPDDEIVSATEAWCKAQPSYRLAAEFQADFAARLASQMTHS
jgi:catechol-2,3-dioxygenase